MSNNSNTTANNSNKLNAFASAICESIRAKKGQLGICVTYYVEPKMRKTNNPYIGHVRKFTTISNARLGVAYESCVNGKLERMGETPDYQAGKSTTRYVNEFIQESNDGKKQYLKIGINATTKIESVYYVDGAIATDQQMAEIDTFLYKSAPSQRQINAGINPDDVYRHITPNVENILYITQGKQTLYDIDFDMLKQWQAV